MKAKNKTKSKTKKATGAEIAEQVKVVMEALRAHGMMPPYVPATMPVSMPVPVALQEVRTEPLKATVLLGPECRNGELLAFSASIGSPLPGGGNRNLVATSAETNLRVANMLVADRMVVRHVRFEIPRVAPARFQQALPCGKQPDYTVTAEDLRQILTTTVLSLYVGGDKAWFRDRLDAAHAGPLPPANAVERGTFTLPTPMSIGRVEKFWVELSWPASRPVFGHLCADANIEARIPIAIYLIP